MTPLTDPALWSDLLRRTLERYDEPLVRAVAARLIRPRSEWPVADLVERIVAAVGNPVIVDRRLRELPTPCRRLLALLAHSRQPRWRMGSLLELLAALGHAEGPAPIFTLLEYGLLYPELPAGAGRLASFEQWLGQASAVAFTVFSPPQVAGRALGEDLGLPSLVADGEGEDGAVAGPPQEADGLDWPLRLAVLWQQVVGSPLRQTQQSDFFKRDLDRLRSDPLLNAPGMDSPTQVPDAGLLAVCLARLEGLLRVNDGEYTAGVFPPCWEEGLQAVLASLWSALPRLEDWNVLEGWRGSQASGNPFAAANFLALLLLAALPPDQWVAPVEVGDWVIDHHPYWQGDGVRPSRLRDWASTFLLGLAYPLRWVQAARAGAGWVVRLSPLGRWLLGLGEAPAPEPGFKQTLLVQPNLEVVAYRQGLTTALIARLARCAAWKSLGAACTLQLDPDSIYRALESGLRFEDILQILEQHGTRATPAPVIESLRTWANKHDRISIYASAAVLEFNTPEDLQEALARGLPGVRLSERLVAVPQEELIDYKHFRLTGTRDYGLPPEKCVEVEADGVTLSVDLSRSDLLLETELPRFAEPLDTAPANGRRRYRLTPASLTAARDGGLTLASLEAWFAQRTGGPLPPASRLLLTGGQLPPPQLRRHLVLRVAEENIADGLMQWPDTRELIEERLGPTALVVAEDNAEALQAQLRALGIDGSAAPSD
jgi:hypothetical protein